MSTFKHPVIGQEAVVPDGLGRVVAFCDSRLVTERWIKVEPYISGQASCYCPENVMLVKIDMEVIE